MSIPYTNLVIKYQNSIITDQTAFIPSVSNFYIKITAPTNTLPMLGQSLGEQSIIPIPADGILKLKLIPTVGVTNTSEQGYYTVKYYKKDNYINNFREERWVVPLNLPLSTIDFKYDPAYANQITFNEPVYSINKIEPNLPYTITYDSLVWVDTPPAVGSFVKIVYQPGVTLDTVTKLADTTFRHKIYNSFGNMQYPLNGSYW